MKKAERSKERLSGFYYNNGFIRNKVTMSIDSVGDKRGKITYKVVGENLTLLIQFLNLLKALL